MIEVLKQALEALKDVGVLTDREWQAVHKNKVNELRQAIAELESQEPMAHMYPDDLEKFQTDETFAYAYSVEMGSPTKGETVPLYTHPPQPAKPIPCANHCEATAFEIVIKNLQGEIERLKASQRTWVGLTDEIPKGVLLAISNAGLTLVKTQHGYELRKLGPVVANGIKE